MAAASANGSTGSVATAAAAADGDVTKSQFDGKDFYAVLGVAKDAPLTEIKRAYRVLALRHHPDRNAGDKQAGRDFQVLGRIMEILSDAKKRANYDQFGDVDNEDTTGSATFDEQYNHWRAIFRQVTTEDIDAYAKTYRNSAEEKDDVFHYYNKFSGDLTKVMAWIPLSGEDDIPRYVKWIDAAIKAKTLTKYKSYPASKKNAKSAESKYAHEAEEAAALKDELIAKARAAAGIDAKAAGGGGGGGAAKSKSKAGGDPDAELRALITSKHAKQFGSFVDSLEAKYGGGGKSKKKSSAATAAAESEPSEEAFASARARLNSRKSAADSKSGGGGNSKRKNENDDADGDADDAEDEDDSDADVDLEAADKPKSKSKSKAKPKPAAAAAAASRTKKTRK